MDCGGVVNRNKVINIFTCAVQNIYFSVSIDSLYIFEQSRNITRSCVYRSSYNQSTII